MTNGLLMGRSATGEILRSIAREDLDAAIDAAGKASSAIVSHFAAAPVRAGSAKRSLEVAVEFFVPPASGEDFIDALERALARQSQPYATARVDGAIPTPVRVRIVYPGAFHQCAVERRKSERAQHEQRWSGVRELIDAVLWQSESGWRELAGG